MSSKLIGKKVHSVGCSGGKNQGVLRERCGEKESLGVLWREGKGASRIYGKFGQWAKKSADAKKLARRRKEEPWRVISAREPTEYRKQKRMSRRRLYLNVRKVAPKGPAYLG